MVQPLAQPAGHAGRRSPRVGSGFKRGDWRNVGLGRTILEVLIQKWPQDLSAKVERGVAVES